MSGEFLKMKGLFFIDDRFDYGELRFVTIGLLRGIIVTITYTENDETTRIITARKSTKMNNENTLKESQTDWARLDAMTDEDIDLSDCPEITEEMWVKGVWRKGSKSIPTKSQENLPVNRDIIEFFKAQDFNYPLKINQLLRAYMEAHQAK